MRHSLLLLLTICSAMALHRCNSAQEFTTANTTDTATQDSIAKRQLAFRQLQPQITTLGKLVDAHFTDSTDLNSLLVFKTINSEGEVSETDLIEALTQYKYNIRYSHKVDISDYPFFEIKNTSQVILPVIGKGLWDQIWANVVFDKTTMKVVNIVIDPNNETPMLGGNINDSTFINQFIGTTLAFDRMNYNIKNYQGEHPIDALTGATITSIGAVQMLNQYLIKYKGYFE